MTKKMESGFLKSTLSGVVGHIVVETKEEKRQYENLNKPFYKCSNVEVKKIFKSTDFFMLRFSLCFKEIKPQDYLAHLNS